MDNDTKFNIVFFGIIFLVIFTKYDWGLYLLNKKEYLIKEESDKCFDADWQYDIYLDCKRNPAEFRVADCKDIYTFYQKKRERCVAANIKLDNYLQQRKN